MRAGADGGSMVALRRKNTRNYHNAPHVSCMAMHYCLLVISRDQGSLIAIGNRNPRPSSPEAPPGARSIARTIMSDPLSSRIASGLQTAKAWEDPQLLKTVRDSIPFQKLLPEWYANVHRNDGVDDDGGGSTPPPGDALLHHMFLRRVFQSAEDDTASQSHTSPYARDDDASYEGDDLLLKRLTLYFKLDVMTWVNNPCCDSCGDTNTTNCGIRGPMTTEEVQGQAGRVECKSSSQCNSFKTYCSNQAHLSFVSSLHKTKN